jgi:hypothetical protein
MRTNLQQTDGLITHSDILWGWPGSRRLVDYDYTVDGRHYHGQRSVSYFRTLDAYLRDGSRILVWYDSANPSVSYPVRRPFPFALVVVGFIPIIVGCVVAGFALQEYT